ncbi:MAG: hypothetical protein CL912_27495 [Deltaproteobacteria bacterium]|nr:hypothetical protein [Deltaproteobacteria bacterium]
MLIEPVREVLAVGIFVTRRLDTFYFQAVPYPSAQPAMFFIAKATRKAKIRVHIQYHRQAIANLP